MTPSSDSEARPNGLRARKREQTLRRLTEAGLRLFSTRGYDATTLDAIAAEAGVSRRTFFHYFKSKDEILLSLQSGLGDRLVEALGERTDRAPLEGVYAALRGVIDAFPHDELIVIDRLMRSSAAVQARKQASYARDEATLYAALRLHWPDEPDAELRLVAMLSIGMSRLALDTWSQEGGQRPLTALLDEAFDALDALCLRRLGR